MRQVINPDEFETTNEDVEATYVAIKIIVAVGVLVAIAITTLAVYGALVLLKYA